VRLWLPDGNTPDLFWIY